MRRPLRSAIGAAGRADVGAELLLLVAAAADEDTAAVLADARGLPITSHVGRAALQVRAGRCDAEALPAARGADVAALLAWLAQTPAPLVAVARAFAAAHVTAGDPRARLAPLRPLGAVARHADEVRAGARAFGAIDDLSRAAVLELRARDAARDGLSTAAAADLEQAAAYLLAYLDAAARAESPAGARAA